MRVTENMRFNTTVYNLFNNQYKYNDIMEKIATQKNVNRASDDPIAATKILDIRRGKAAIEQYKQNMEFSSSWIAATESTLSGAYDLLATATGIAAGSLGADAATIALAATNIQDIIASMRSLANTKWGDRYLFSGTREDVAPFPADPSVATIEVPQKASGNTFAGTVTSTGTYTGDVNKTYAVKIIEGGLLGVATYQFSSDGGRTWNGPDLDFGTVSTATVGSGAVSQVIKGSVANTAGGPPPTLIDSTTVWNTITDANVQDGTTFTITGKKHNGDAVSVSYTIANAANTVQDLLTAIQTAFGAVTATIDAAGKITVTDNVAGASQLEMTLVGSLPMAGGSSVNLGDGVTMTFGAGTFGANDIFYVNAAPAGYYQGNDENLSTNIDRGTSYEYSLTGAEVFTAAGAGGVDIFTALADLHAALTNDAVANTTGGTTPPTPIDANTLIKDIDGYTGYQVTDYIRLEGTDTNGIAVMDNTLIILATTTVDDLLSQIESKFGAVGDVTAFIASDGKLKVTDNTSGASLLTVRITVKNTAGTDDGTLIFNEGQTFTIDQQKVLSDQMTNLENAQTQILLNQSLCGTKAGHIEVVKNNVTQFDESLTSLLSSAQDANITELAVRMSVQELAMQEAYAIAAKIGENTILNFLK